MNNLPDNPPAASAVAPHLAPSRARPRAPARRATVPRTTAHRAPTPRAPTPRAPAPRATARCAPARRVAPVAFSFFLLHFSFFIPSSAAPATKPALSTSAPVKNFRLPAFNEQGHRTSLLTAGESRYISPEQIDVIRLDFAIYPGDGTTRVETRLTAPTASFFLKNTAAPRASGKESVRLVHENEIDATGEDWAYDHGQKKLWINKNVRLVFPVPLQDILK
ncbi:MAG: hypothetical protein LBI02_08570 [Opitutaceae bacterium]|jgi:hypothetical protein|nr:hypothetical protein [Opitutaceae bacterium]